MKRPKSSYERRSQELQSKATSLPTETTFDSENQPHRHTFEINPFPSKVDMFALSKASHLNLFKTIAGGTN